MDREFPALEDLKAGSDPAWEAAFSFLWPVAMRAARDPRLRLTFSEAQEIASDAVRFAVDQIERVRTRQDLFALVAVISRRRAISITRGKTALKRSPAGFTVESEPLDAEEVSLTQGVAPDPSTDTAVHEMVALLNQVLNDLDAQSRNLLMDKYVFGFSYEEMSKKYDAPLGTLCPRVMRALRKVRQSLAKRPVLMKELETFLR